MPSMTSKPLFAKVVEKSPVEVRFGCTELAAAEPGHYPHTFPAIKERCNGMTMAVDDAPAILPVGDEGGRKSSCWNARGADSTPESIQMRSTY